MCVTLSPNSPHHQQEILTRRSRWWHHLLMKRQEWKDRQKCECQTNDHKNDISIDDAKRRCWRPNFLKTTEWRMKPLFNTNKTLITSFFFVNKIMIFLRRCQHSMRRRERSVEAPRRMNGMNKWMEEKCNWLYRLCHRVVPTLTQSYVTCVCSFISLL